VIATLLLGAMILAPVYSATVQPSIYVNTGLPSKEELQKMPEPDVLGIEQPGDTRYIPKENVNLAGEQNDLNYNIDARNNIVGSLFIYPGEPVDVAPGRGRTGSLDPSEGDTQDWYRFTACEGQTIQASIATSQDFALTICDASGKPVVGSSYTAVETGWHFLQIYANDGATTGDYTVSLTLSGQNDAGTGGDAGDTSSAATAIPSGEYTGYMDSSDVEDWYSFQANTGQGIEVRVEPLERSDFDVHLYNPSGELVLSGQYYGEDSIEYPADASGTWKIQLDIFPGWDTSKWPDDYFLYGSGAYELDLTVGGTVDPPVTPEPQPDVTPVAQTFIVNNDPDSNKDEYGYLAAVPAANYLENGERFVSPIVYQGIDYMPTWFTSVDQTTQYLIDDWNTYLDRHGMTAETFEVPADPVQAAADIAAAKWDTADTAVVVCDGSSFNDELVSVIDGDFSLSSTPEINRYAPGDFKTFGSASAVPMYLGNQWGAIHMIALGDDFQGDTGIITPRYEAVKTDDWPSPYDMNGPDYDTWYPITKTGIWIPEITSEGGLEELQIIKYPGNRYTIPVDTTDCSIEVNLETEEESTLLAILVDPMGNVRRPNIPRWNGGEIQPIHYWNGGHWEHNFDDYRYWIVEPHKDMSIDLHYPMEGSWTLIVVPYFEHPARIVEFNGDYHLTATIRKHNPDRINAAMSAANGAVLASINHAPLLYVTKDAVPSQTSSALSSLGVNKIIFVNVNDVSSASLSGTVTEYTTMQQVVDAIKDNPGSENYITVTSLGSGDGYFAPSAMIAAYHIAPVLNIGEAPDAYSTNDKHGSWREWGGDGYHGCMTPSHLPMMDEPTTLKNPLSPISFIIYFLTHQQQIPPVGLDLKLQWNSEVYQGMHALIDGYGLDLSGPEAYLFVAPRYTDIRHIILSTMTGNNSYAGQIPVETSGFASAIIARTVLYPALIYANPGRDIATSQIVNYPDGYVWNANDGNGYNNYATREIKEIFSSRDRFYEGHCIVMSYIQRLNDGASISYYSGHGTGGSGVSGQFKNIAETFPLAEPRYEKFYDFDWWDAWRGYSGYDDLQTKTPRYGGESGYSAEEPNLYDIVHFKWIDQLLGNLHSEFEMWSSCSTGDQFGPTVYLAHGSTLWFGAAGSVYGIQDDLHNAWMFHDMLVEGKPLGESWAKYQWLFDRDYTTNDPTTLYGRSTWFQGGLTNEKVLYGDPAIQIYAPDWIEPTPIAP
jgi:hypothetical protein